LEQEDFTRKVLQKIASKRDKEKVRGWREIIHDDFEDKASYFVTVVETSKNEHTIPRTHGLDSQGNCEHFSRFIFRPKPLLLFPRGIQFETGPLSIGPNAGPGAGQKLEILPFKPRFWRDKKWGARSGNPRSRPDKICLGGRVWRQNSASMALYLQLMSEPKAPTKNFQFGTFSKNYP
jgi:hypothetical protein